MDRVNVVQGITGTLLWRW